MDLLIVFVLTKFEIIFEGAKVGIILQNLKAAITRRDWHFRNLSFFLLLNLALIRFAKNFIKDILIFFDRLSFLSFLLRDIFAG